MVQYDRSILESFATDLEKQARNVIAISGLIGFLVGGALGYGLGKGPLPLGLAMLGAVMGIAIGRARAFQLRVQAHTLLCQVEIEKNTRKS